MQNNEKKVYPAVIDKLRMFKMAQDAGITLSDGQLERLDRFATCLVETNRKINLTAITEPKEIETKHFLDSLMFAVCPAVQGRVVDVGSGAGFPGLVAAIYNPELSLTLMEPTGKRVEFLRQTALELGLSVEVVKERAEEAARKQWRERYDTACARAVASLPALCEYCLPLVKPGGVFIAMKTDAGDELNSATRAIDLLGGRVQGITPYSLPGGASRCLVIIEKLKPTPPQYPRAGGVIAKRPL